MFDRFKGTRSILQSSTGYRNFLILLTLILASPLHSVAQFIAPSITSVSPSSASANNPAGFTVTVIGTGFNDPSHGTFFPEGVFPNGASALFGSGSGQPGAGFLAVGGFSCQLVVSGNGGVCTAQLAAGAFNGIPSGQYQLVMDWCNDSCFSPNTAPFTIIPSPPPQMLALQMVSGDGQIVVTSEDVKNPLTVQVTDQNGNPVSGVTIDFTLTSLPSGATNAFSPITVITGADGTASTTIKTGILPGTYQVTAQCSSCLQPNTVTFSFTAQALNVDVIMSAFIMPETVEGPGILWAPLANGLPQPLRVPAIVAGAVAGITCADLESVPTTVPPIEAEILRYSGNDRSFSSTATSYKVKDAFTLNSDASLHPQGLVAPPIITTIPSKSWAPNSFSGPFLTAEAKADTQPSKPRCNLLYDRATPRLNGMQTNVSRTDTKITSHLTARIGDPLIVNTDLLNRIISRVGFNVPNLLDYAAPLKANLTVLIDLTDNTYTVTGTHTCYPAFELYLNNLAIYTFSPDGNDFHTISNCLALGGNTIDVNASGKVPIQ